MAHTHNLEGPEEGQFFESLKPPSDFEIVGEEIESGIFNAGWDGWGFFLSPAGPDFPVALSLLQYIL